MSKLLIVESPAKAKTIEKYLDGEFVVKASVGHIRDLPKSNKKAIDIKAGFVPHYETSKGKEKIIRDLKKFAKESDEVILATDPDREGEAIAWHLSEALNLKDPKRIVFNEITKEAVQDAMKNPRTIDDNLRRAQEARRVLDRLVGYDLSGLIWKKVRYGLSAGRVQSPALRIIMEREREIRAFKPEQYWIISADVETKDKETLILTCTEKLTDGEIVKEIVKVGKSAKWVVSEVKESDQKRSPRAPFTTSTMQQAANSRLGLSPSRTMGIAQKLYERGHITYMRTDSPTLSKTAIGQATGTIEKEFGKEFVQIRVFKTKSKSAQEAHEAIRPTNFSKGSAGTSPEQKKLYSLIRARTLASQMADAKLKKTRIVISIGEKIPTFSANGSRVSYPGWLLADPSARGEDTNLPKISSADTLNLLDIYSEEKETSPPPRYSEAGLVKEMEKRGIGRPSTYASVIKTLKDRGYVDKEGKSLIPTDTGDVVSTFLENNFSDYISDSFTSEMENELDEIAAGKREYKKTLEDFYIPFAKEIDSKESIEKLTNLGPTPDEFKCPKCKKDMVFKLSKNGKFMSCSDFPECQGARTAEGEELEGTKETGENCPECKPGKLVERDGRYGRFISCNRYPKCKFIKEDPEAAKKASTGVKCPECKKGEMLEKRGRYGLFYSCSQYPDCKNAIKAKPTGEKCPMCGKLMMEGTKTIPERCSDKTCPNHRPDKLKNK